MTVKRYTPTQCCEHDGTYVTYSDYQKLVAENAALKELSSYVGMRDDYINYERVVELRKCYPATDAAIAEIGAKAIENAINAQSGKPCITDKNGLAHINLGGIQDFAANLRAGRKG